MKVRTVLIWEGCANAAVSVAKLVIGLKTGSAAILSDALHSLTDLANNVIAYFASKIAGEPADSDHPYGHHKFEQLAVFVLASLLTIVAFELILASIKRFGSVPKHDNIGLAIMLGVLVINVVVSIWEGYWARKLESQILLADARHTISDVLTTVAVIAGWQLAVHGWPWLDPLFAVLVALMVLYLAYDLFRRAVPILVDSAGYDPRKLSLAIAQINGVRGVKRVRSRMYGSGNAADIVIMVDRQLSTERAHGIADEIESLLEERYAIHDTTVHIEPCDVSAQVSNRMSERYDTRKW
ncbi:MAG: cation transporter [Gammaproteobacteria bacterium]|nr:cation transporter [Gammaproteobacteria bacterium]